MSSEPDEEIDVEGEKPSCFGEEECRRDSIYCLFLPKCVEEELMKEVKK